MECIHNTFISFKLMNGPNKIECYFTLGWKSSRTNTLAYFCPSVSKLEKNCCEYASTLSLEMRNLRTIRSVDAVFEIFLAPNLESASATFSSTKKREKAIQLKFSASRKNMLLSRGAATSRTGRRQI